MRRIKKIFLKGLITVIPIVATIALFVWLVTFAEGLASKTLKYLFPNIAYWPGMGVIFVFLFIFVVGILFECMDCSKDISMG